MRDFFDLRIFLVFLLPPLKTVTGGTTTPVCGSTENLRGISTNVFYFLFLKIQSYLLRVALRPFLVAFLDLRALRVLRLPPFKGIVVGHPIPPGKLHHT